jgi:hypothetical protein
LPGPIKSFHKHITALYGAHKGPTNIKKTGAVKPSQGPSHASWRGFCGSLLRAGLYLLPAPFILKTGSKVIVNSSLFHDHIGHVPGLYFAVYRKTVLGNGAYHIS